MHEFPSLWTIESYLSARGISTSDLDKYTELIKPQLEDSKESFFPRSYSCCNCCSDCRCAEQFQQVNETAQLAAKLGIALLQTLDQIGKEANTRVQNMQSSLSLLENKNKSLETRNAQLINDNKQLLGRLEECNTSLGTAEEKISGLSQYLESYRNQFTNISGCELDIEVLEQSLEQLEAENSLLRQQLAKSNEDKLSAYVKSRRIDRELSALYADLEGLHTHAINANILQQKDELTTPCKREQFPYTPTSAVRFIDKQNNGQGQEHRSEITRLITDILQDREELYTTSNSLKQQLARAQNELFRMRASDISGYMTSEDYLAEYDEEGEEDEDGLEKDLYSSRRLLAPKSSSNLFTPSSRNFIDSSTPADMMSTPITDRKSRNRSLSLPGGGYLVTPELTPAARKGSMKFTNYPQQGSEYQQHQESRNINFKSGFAKYQKSLWHSLSHDSMVRNSTINPEKSLSTLEDELKNATFEEECNQVQEESDLVIPRLRPSTSHESIMSAKIAKHSGFKPCGSFLLSKLSRTPSAAPAEVSLVTTGAAGNSKKSCLNLIQRQHQRKDQEKSKVGIVDSRRQKRIDDGLATTPCTNHRRDISAASQRLTILRAGSNNSSTRSTPQSSSTSPRLSFSFSSFTNKPPGLRASYCSTNSATSTNTSSGNISPPPPPPPINSLWGEGDDFHHGDSKISRQHEAQDILINQDALNQALADSIF